MSNQLIKTTEQGKENVFPRTRIQDLFDDTSGQKLIDILRSFNMMFVPYLGSKSYTRNQISPELRRQGLWLTYVIDNTVYTEWYGEVAIDDTNWGSDSNWRQGSNALVGDLSISPNGTWVINGEDSGITIKGDKGDSPVIRIYDNRIQVSYDKGITYEDLNNTPIYTTFRTEGNRLQVSTDLGTTWENCSEPIAAWFRWADVSGTGNVGKVQISRDQQNWSDLSPTITNNLYIKGYVDAIGNLPSNAAIGDIYMVGPTYNESDVTHDYPHYRMWVKQSSGWVDNGEYQSNVQISQTTGQETGITMSQKAITKLNEEQDQKISELEGKKLNKSEIEAYKQSISTSVANQDKDISDFKDAITDQVNNYKPIVINGNVTNAADEEDLHADLETGLISIANRSALNGMGYVILRKNKSFAEQVTKENIIYEIRYDFDLNGEEITIPKGCILKFNGGKIKGTINCNNTFLEGTVNISKITGTICNKYVYASWFLDDNFSENIVSIFNSNSILYLDKDITMDGTNKTVNILKIEGNGYTIYNSCSYKITSNYVELNNIKFKEYTNKNTFLTFYTDYTEAYLTLNKIEFDGNNNCNRFFNWLDTVKKLHLNININNCVFCNITSVVIRHCGTGQGFIQNNKFYSIGTLDDTNNTIQMCISLGTQYKVTNLVNNVIINNNTFNDIKTVFTDKNDGKETHAIIIYGYNCIIENNLIKNIYSSREDKDPGAESEGIYVKGSNNKIINNMLIDASGGTQSDGAITLKGADIQDYYGKHYNIISGNSIIFNNNYGSGITSYGTNTNIINNTIKLGGSKDFAINFLIAEDSLIEGNIISTSPDIIKGSTETVNGAFAITNSKNLIFRNNRLEVVTLCAAYSNDESPIIFENNYILVANNAYGATSKYNTFFQTLSHTPNVVFNNNYIEISNIRASAFWECKGYLLAKNNYFKIRNKAEHEPTTNITGIFRFLHSVILIDNIFDIDESVPMSPALFYQLQENATAISHNTIFTNRGSINYSSINRDTTNIFQKTIGTTEDRNNIKLNYKSNMEGYQFFDTTLGKPCYAKTINNKGIVTWVDATGNNV